MKRTTFFYTLVFLIASQTVVFAGPCNGVSTPEDTRSNEVVFEIPTYKEYIQGVFVEALNTKKSLAENNILNEEVYDKVRAEKVKTINAVYTNGFRIMTKGEVKMAGINEGFLFQEKYISELVAENNTKFEQYTAFTVKDLNTMSHYTLANPAQAAVSNCIVKKRDYKFEELLAIIKE